MWHKKTATNCIQYIQWLFNIIDSKKYKDIRYTVYSQVFLQIYINGFCSRCWVLFFVVLLCIFPKLAFVFSFCYKQYIYVFQYYISAQHIHFKFTINYRKSFHVILFFFKINKLVYVSLIVDVIWKFHCGLFYSYLSINSIQERK